MASWQWLGVVLAIALTITGVIMLTQMRDLNDRPAGEAACLKEKGCEEYYDGSSTERTINVVLGVAAGVVALLGALAGFAFAATGRGGPILLGLTGLAVGLGALAIVYGIVIA